MIIQLPRILPGPDYDSGYFAIAQGATVLKTHGLDGDPDDFLVQLTFKSGGKGINQDGYGKRWTAASMHQGGDWRLLTSTTITVFRSANDTQAPEMRVRIWRYQT